MAMPGDRDLIIELGRRIDRLTNEVSLLREDLSFQKGKLAAAAGFISATVSAGVSWLTIHLK